MNQGKTAVIPGACGHPATLAWFHQDRNEDDQRLMAARRLSHTKNLLAAALFAAPIADASAQTLGEALSAAYQSNPTIAAALDELRGTDEQLAQAYQYWWRPEITGTLQYGKEYIESDTDTQFTEFTQGGQSIDDFTETVNVKEVEGTATLYLWCGGQTSAAIDSARATIQAQEAIFDSTVQSTLSTAAQAYADVVFEAVSLNLSYEHENDLRQIQVSVEDLLAGRDATTVDLAQVRLSVIETQNSRAETLGELQAARSAFNASVGSYPTELQQWPALPALPDTLDEAIEIARAQSPAIAAARAEVIANEAAVQEDEGTLLPTISIVGDYTLLIDDTRFNHSIYRAEYSCTATSSVMLEVTIPFYTGGLYYSEVRESKRLVAQSRNKLIEAERTAVDSVTSAWQRLDAAEQRIELGYAQWSAAADALSGMEKQFEQSLITVKDLLDAMGRFNGAALELDVTAYDPAAYLNEIMDLPLGIGLD
ncbi:MAG: TolC family protein [Rhodospirillaceae bacterium]|nr:TolC family protein [Rhodospirillaceae bacterium]MBT6508979.1 TolC family protein [Rhodospirillaceae bacterium]MBT7614498.1 TolC family protein [Rhodospirillaceae bacterium]MBT7646501.1 TolC family protein [Rhodospirillaceae bacterium]